MRATIIVPAVAALGLATAAPAAEQSQRRYTMSPTDGGFIRLDTATGSMSLCSRKDGNWVCEAMADPSADLRQQVDRLTEENAELKAEVKRLEDLVGLGGDPGPGTGSERRTERPRGQLQLPNEQDVDRALNYIQRMFRKFKDKLKEFDGHYRPPTPL
jgi:hypothetical protein